MAIRKLALFYFFLSVAFAFSVSGQCAPNVTYSAWSDAANNCGMRSFWDGAYNTCCLQEPDSCLLLDNATYQGNYTEALDCPEAASGPLYLWLFISFMILILMFLVLGAVYNIPILRLVAYTGLFIFSVLFALAGVHWKSGEVITVINATVTESQDTYTTFQSRALGVALAFVFALAFAGELYIHRRGW